MSKALLAAAVRRRTALTQAASRKAVDAVIESIAELLRSGDAPLRVKHFGTFRRVRRLARKARNPLTGESVQVPARTKIKFVASEELLVADAPSTATDIDG